MKSVLVCLLWAVTSCSSHSAPPPAQEETPPAEQKPPDGPCLTLGRAEISLLECASYLEQLGLPPETDKRALLGPLLVKEEASRQGMHCGRLSLPQCMDKIFNQIFPANENCLSLDSPELSLFFKQQWQPDWDFEFYKGRMYECGNSKELEVFEKMAMDQEDGFVWHSCRARSFIFRRDPQKDPLDAAKDSYLFPEAVAALEATPKGEKTPVLAGPHGFTILYLKEFRPARLFDDTEVKQALRRQVCQDLAQAARLQYMQDLLKTAFVEVH